MVGGAVWLSSDDDARANLTDIRSWDHMNIGAWNEGSTVALSLVVPNASVPTVSLTAEAPVLEGEDVTMVATLSSVLTSDVVIPVYVQGRFSEPGDHGTISSITVSAGQTSGTAVIATNHDTDTCDMNLYPRCGDEVFRVALRPSLPTAVRPAISADAMVPYKFREVWVDIIDDEAPRPNVWLTGSVIHAPGDPVNVLHEGGEARVTVAHGDSFFSDVTIPLIHGPQKSQYWHLPAEAGDYTVPSKVVIPYRQGDAVGRIPALQDGDTDDDMFWVQIDVDNLPSWLAAKEPGRPIGWSFTITDDDNTGSGDSAQPPDGQCQNCAILGEPGALYVPQGEYAELIAKMYEWRNDPDWAHHKSHTDRWDRALLAFGEEVEDETLTPMTAAEAQAFADSGMDRWVDVAAALREIEADNQQQDPPANRAPTVASALADVSGLEAGGTRDVSLFGVFEDADGDALILTAASSDEAVATVSIAATNPMLTISGVAEGTATITVTAEDADSEQASDSFEVSVAGSYAELIAQMYQWRNDPDWAHHKSHTDRWDRALLAFGEEVEDETLTPMTAAEAQAFADSGMDRWVDVAAALREIEADNQQQDPPANRAPTVASALADVSGLEAGGTRDVSLFGVFDDPDGDALTITAASSDEAKATVSVAADGSKLTVAGAAEGTATITVTAQDPDGNRAVDTFNVTVANKSISEDGGTEPANVQVVPGDGALTVSWTVTSREGVEDGEIRHALRWSQESGVWANPGDPRAGGPEDGIGVEGGVSSYVITGLKNGVATGVFVRSFTGNSYSELSEHSSQWVRVKGEHTTPRGEGQPTQQAQAQQAQAQQAQAQQAQELTAPALTVQAAAGAVELRWAAVAGAVRYELMVWWDGLPDWQPLGGDNLSGASYTHSDVTAGTKYYYTISAVNAAGETSDWLQEPYPSAIAEPEQQQAQELQPTATPTSTMTPTPTPTPTPQTQELTAPALTVQAAAGAVELRWAAVAGAVRYELMVWWDGVTDWQPLGGDNLTGTSYTHTDVTAGTTYYYIIRAVNAGGETSDWQQEPYPSATVPD